MFLIEFHPASPFNMFQLQTRHCRSLQKLTLACCFTSGCTNHTQQSRFSSYVPLSFYQVLGLENNATQAQIKSAYYKLSKKYHPDKNDGSKSSQDMFAKINEAYSVLGNSKLRRRYDQGILTHRDQMGHPPHHSEPVAEHPRARDMGDQFTATFRSAHTEHVIDEFLKKRYRENIDRHQEGKRYNQQRYEEYKALQDRAQRTPVVLLGAMIVAFAVGSYKLMEHSFFSKNEGNLKFPKK